MITRLRALVCLAFISCLFAGNSIASDNHNGAHSVGPACTDFGPQTPRDIDGISGENKNTFKIAPSYKEMNLCNIHMHTNAEHKAKHSRSTPVKANTVTVVVINAPSAKT